MSDQIKDYWAADIHARLSKLEERFQEFREGDAARETATALLIKDMDYLKKSTDKLSSGINRVFWAIGLSAVGVVTHFALSGGFNLP